MADMAQNLKELKEISALLAQHAIGQSARAIVAQCNLRAHCQRSPKAQAPDEWLTALARWTTHHCAISA